MTNSKNTNNHKRRTGDRAKIIQALRSVKISDGEIILVKSQTMLSKENNLQDLSWALRERDLKKCIAIIVDDFDDLSVLTEDKMNELGWYRKDETIETVSDAS